MDKQPIVVAMSGGVDSSAAAIMLKEQGHSVIGISMQVWDYRKNNGNAKKATCCAPADFEDARDVASANDFPFYVFDFEESFYDSVISPFVKSYVEGYTPNPCLECNRKVKFRELRKRAKSLGANIVATGHYAQIKKLPDGSFGLFTGLDTDKDQSYFLYAMTQVDLAHTLFPVGGLKKPEVRGYLANNGVGIAEKEESFDICFVSGSVGEFVKRQTKEALKGGKIVNSAGKELGEHKGIHNFTVGQRKGLGLSNPNPLYVLQVDSVKNEVIVGELEDLKQESFTVRDVNWISGLAPTEEIIASVKLRYRHAGVPCRIIPTKQGNAEITFIDQWSAVAPGQAAVFYSTETDEDGSLQVLGGGIIEKGSI